METKITFQKFFGHLKTVLVHKYWVFYYACKLGIPWRGFKHDLSKFSPTEFWESVRYWDGKSSPIPRCKEDRGYSLAWQHHKGRNSHHYEYWVDYLDQGGVAIKMPWKDFLEMAADWLGAGRAYWGKKFTLESEYQYVLTKLRTAKMHTSTAHSLEYIFKRFSQDPNVLKYFQRLAPRWKKMYEENEIGPWIFEEKR